MKTLPAIFFFIASIIGTQEALAADSGDIVVSGADEISHLIISGRRLHVNVEAHEGEASIRWSREDRTSELFSATQRTIELPSPGPYLQRSDDLALLQLDESDDSWSVYIRAPEHWELTVSVMERGNIELIGRKGAVSAWTARGDVTLVEQTGSFSITTMDGEVNVDIVNSPSETSAITVWNGSLTLTVPPSIDTRLRILEVLRLETNVAALQSANPETGTHGTAYLLNRGGAEITLRNLNGTVRVLNRDSKP